MVLLLYVFSIVFFFFLNHPPLLTLPCTVHTHGSASTPDQTHLSPLPLSSSLSQSRCLELSENGISLSNGAQKKTCETETNCRGLRLCTVCAHNHTYTVHTYGGLERWGHERQRERNPEWLCSSYCWNMVVSTSLNRDCWGMRRDVFFISHGKAGIKASAWEKL